SAGVAIVSSIADFEDLDLLDSAGGAELDGVTLTRSGQRAGDWGHPADLAAGKIGFVDAHDRDRGFGPALDGVGDGSAKEHLVEPFLLSRADHLGDFPPL